MKYEADLREMQLRLQQLEEETKANSKSTSWYVAWALGIALALSLLFVTGANAHSGNPNFAEDHSDFCERAHWTNISKLERMRCDRIRELETRVDTLEILVDRLIQLTGERHE